MFCSQCGKQVDPSSRFCPACGATISSAAPPPGYYPNTGKLMRSRENRVIAGVCAGFALHYGWDVKLVRVLTAVFTFFSAGTGILVYLIAWVIIPEAPYTLPAKGF